MNIEQIKHRMIAWKDFYGGDISDVESIKNAKTKKELKDILWKHSHFMEDMLADAQSHISNFKKQLGLHKVI